MMAKCVGFTTKGLGLKTNCANCENWNGSKCLVQKILNELYEESRDFDVFNHMMRGNRGISGPM